MPPRSCPRAPFSSDVYSEDDVSPYDWNPRAYIQHPAGRESSAPHHFHRRHPLQDPIANSSMIHRRVRTPPREACSRRRHPRNTAFHAKLAQMKIRLSPIVQISTGAVHPAFPRTILNFWLLTERQLDELAEFYHQRYPSELTMAYPCPVEWPATGLTIADKRRKMGRFIGLRGCETPIVMKTEEEIMEEVRKNAALEEEQRLRGKLGRGSI